MSATPRFFSQPLKYLHWAAIEKPAIFYSLIIGSMGPVLVLTVPPIRRRLGDVQRPPIPSTYPGMLLLPPPKAEMWANKEHRAIAGSTAYARWTGWTSGRSV